MLTPEKLDDDLDLLCRRGRVHFVRECVPETVPGKRPVWCLSITLDPVHHREVAHDGELRARKVRPMHPCFCVPQAVKETLELIKFI